MSTLRNGEFVIAADSDEVREVDDLRKWVERFLPHDELGRVGEILPIVPGPLPPSLARVLLFALKEIGAGKGVRLTSCGSVVSLEEAAVILNVPESRVLELDREGRLARRDDDFAEAGYHLKELLDYKNDFRRRRSAALDELAALGQELDPEY